MHKYKLVCFDVDGTLVDNVKFSWQVFHDYFQTDKVKREDARNKFMNGDISYLEWANHDLNMWKDKNARKDDFIKALEPLRLMNGAVEVIRELKKNNISLAIISGSLNVVLEKFFPDYNEIFDDIFLSRIHFDKIGNIAKIEATEYDMDKKAEALRKLAEKKNIGLKECVFIGDYLNDIQVLKDAGLGIAFKCKEDRVKEAADIVIEKKDLREVLRFIIKD